MSGGLLDVYAIVERLPSRPHEGLDFVEVGALVAAVRPVVRAPEITERALRARDEAVRGLAALVDAIVPARWGSIVRDEAELAARLAPLASQLETALALVRGREQMTLRLFGARPATPAAEAPRTSGTAYLEGRARALAAARSAPEIDPLRPALAGLVFAERVDRHEASTLLASVHHLIERGRAADYVAAVRSLELPVSVHVSGPSPPYAFAPELSP